MYALNLDVVHRIAVLADVPTRKMLCLTSRNVHQLTAPVLYSTVAIASVMQFLAFDRTVASSRHDLILAVRRFYLTVDLPLSLLPRFAEVFERIPNVQELTLQCNFERMCTTSTLPWHNLKFLRHLNISHVGVHAAVMGDLTAPLQSLRLDVQVDWDNIPSYSQNGMQAIFMHSSTHLKHLAIDITILNAACQIIDFPALDWLRVYNHSIVPSSFERTVLVATPNLREVISSECIFPADLLADRTLWPHLERIQYSRRAGNQDLTRLPLKELRIGGFAVWWASAHDLSCELQTFDCSRLTTLELTNCPWTPEVALAPFCSGLELFSAEFYPSTANHLCGMFATFLTSQNAIPSSLKILQLWIIDFSVDLRPLASRFIDAIHGAISGLTALEFVDIRVDRPYLLGSVTVGTPMLSWKINTASAVVEEITSTECDVARARIERRRNPFLIFRA